MRFFFLFLSLCLSLHAQVSGVYTVEGQTDIRVDRMPALYVKSGEPVTSFLPAGPFTVNWTGEIEIDKRSRVYFSFDGNGDAVLAINGVEALKESGQLGTAESKRLRLNPGKHAITITYKSSVEQDAQFRLMWRGRDFVKEPVPSTSYAVIDQKDPSRAGRQHFLSQKCVNCHRSEDVATTMGPSLNGIGSRVTEAWLTRWISAPDIIKPTTTMPALIDHTTPDGAQAAADVSAYLASLKNEADVSEAVRGDIDQGKVTFHSLGCVGCHTAPNVSKVDYENSRIPLNNVASKYQKGSLTKFLKNPSDHWAEIKMPNFKLSEAEASSLAAYLRDASTGKHTPDPSEFPPGDAVRGKLLTSSLNCATCHEGMPAVQSKPKALSEMIGSDWAAKGCIAEDTGNAPRVNLSAEDKSAILAFSKRITADRIQSISQIIPAEFAAHAVHSQRCTTCHSDGDETYLLSRLHQESARLLPKTDEPDTRVDQSRPALTHMGMMLHTDTIQKMLEGHGHYRPWLDMRMPAFHHDAETFAKGMSAIHGLAPSQNKSEPLDQKKVENGQLLTGAQGGFACITCHGVGDQAALAAFEVQGINFQHVRERLRKGYYMSWMDNPHRLVPTTKMPRYSLGKGKSPLTTVLEGDSEKQFDAIWEYLEAIK